jgi:hypothetical protein
MLARTIRTFIDEVVRGRLLKDQKGMHPSKESVHNFLDEELRSSRVVFVGLAAAAIILALRM